MYARASIIVLMMASLTAAGAAAEEQRPVQPPAAAPQQPQLPVSLEQALYLIRSTLLSLNDANRTGNYTVLRDLGARLSGQQRVAARRDLRQAAQ